jgi:hypothetical protein
VNIADVLEGARTVLATLDSVTAIAWHPSNVSPPLIAVTPDTLTITDTFEIEQTLTLKATLFVSSGNYQQALADLEEFANPTGDRSVVDLIRANRTLGGTCDDCVVVDRAEFGFATVSNIEYATLTWTLEVMG